MFDLIFVYEISEGSSKASQLTNLSSRPIVMEPNHLTTNVNFATFLHLVPRSWLEAQKMQFLFCLVAKKSSLDLKLISSVEKEFDVEGFLVVYLV